MILTWKRARRVAIFVIGMTVVLIGLTLIVLPGPAFVVIPVGLAILATEFVWARRLLDKARAKAHQMGNLVRGRTPACEPGALEVVTLPPEQACGHDESPARPQAGSGTSPDDTQPCSPP